MVQAVIHFILVLFRLRRPSRAERKALVLLLMLALFFTLFFISDDGDVFFLLLIFAGFLLLYMRDRERQRYMNPILYPEMPMEMIELQGREFDGDDYEALMRLDERNAPRMGMSQTAIDMLPEYICTQDSDAGKDGCVVCLEAFRKGQTLRTIPCLHRFHKQCIDHWLQRKSTCPICLYEIRIEDLQV